MQEEIVEVIGGLPFGTVQRVSEYICFDVENELVPTGEAVMTKDVVPAFKPLYTRTHSPKVRTTCATGVPLQVENKGPLEDV
jgi:hypothetical protein